MKYSVIIPTLWRSDLTVPLVERLSQCTRVGEIIIIDNDQARSRIQELNPSKLVPLPQAQNIWVNPAWNLGVQVSRYGALAILNDDILFDPSPVFEMSVRAGEAIGIGLSCYDESPIEPFRIETSPEHTFGWGCAIFLRKSSWCPVPDGLKIWYGDNWIRQKARAAMQIEGLKVQTEMSTTSNSPEFHYLIEEERQNWDRVEQTH
jgi:hypothetical protein